ncbi:MAG: UbiD family decarboxylase, partial [Pseudomonadota bacterium]
MSYASLRDFIDELERTDRLVRVSHPVSTVLEMTEIQTRLLAEQGPAVLFENVSRDDGMRSDMPVLVNLFGTVDRVAAGMGRTPDALRGLGETLAILRQPEPPDGIRDAIDKLPLLKSALSMRPKTVSHAACHDVIWQGEEIDLAKLPVQTCWPGEPAP